MTVRVEMTITVEHGFGDASTFTYSSSRPGDNPRYDASLVRAAILSLAVHADKTTTALYGDIDPARGGGDYTRPLPRPEDWTG
jgi:hypothetical protein